MRKFNEVDQKLTLAKFDLYLSTTDFDDPELQHEIYTCLRGKYSGEVVDVFYKYGTGEVVRIEYSTQFKDQQPKFTI